MACVVYWVALLRGSGGLFSFAILRYPLAFSVFILVVLSLFLELRVADSPSLSLSLSPSIFHYVYFAHHNRILTQDNYICTQVPRQVTIKDYIEKSLAQNMFFFLPL